MSSSANYNSLELLRLNRVVHPNQCSGQFGRPRRTWKMDNYPMSFVHEFRSEDVRLKKTQGIKNVDLAKISKIFKDEQTIAETSSFITLLSYKRSINGNSTSRKFYIHCSVNIFSELANKIPESVLRIKGFASMMSQELDYDEYRLNNDYSETRKVSEFNLSVTCSDVAASKAPIFVFKEFSPSGNSGLLPPTLARTLETCEYHLYLNCLLSLEWDETTRVTKPIAKDSSSIVTALFNDDTTKDFSLVAANGVLVKCHGLILLAQSEVFSRMINPSNKMKESAEKKIDMGHLSESNLNGLVRYFYGMPLPTEDLSCDDALQLLQAAGLYSLTNLETQLQQMIVERELEWFNPNFVVELYFHVKAMGSAEELREHLLSVMSRITDSLRKCQKFKELTKSNADEACMLIWKLHDMAVGFNMDGKSTMFSVD